MKSKRLLTIAAVICLALIVAVLRIGPDEFLAVMMFLSLIMTVLAFIAYLKKGGYVFTD